MARNKTLAADSAVMQLNKSLVLSVLALILIVAGLKLIEFFQTTSVESDASKFVTEDLRSKYPEADVAIMTLTPKFNPGGEKYVEVKARVTEGAGTPCPARSHVFYNYPIQNFIAQPPEVITQNCRVCAESICTIAFPEEAAIASHTLGGTQALAAYIKTYPNTTYSVKEQGDSWITNWDSPTASYGLEVLLYRNGTLTSLESVSKK